MTTEFKSTLNEAVIPNPYDVDISRLDVSDSRLFVNGAIHDYFKRLREEDPVHYLQDSPFGPFWSVTKFEDIVYVDSNHQLFSAEPIILLGDLDEETYVENFISMDPPRHDLQRAAVQPVVAPANLKQMESLIRERVCNILDELPTDEPFDWVNKVSMNLTGQMLCTLFDLPIEMRENLVRWSDLATDLPDLTGGTSERDVRQAALDEVMVTFGNMWQQKAEQFAKGEKLNFDIVSLLVSNEHTRDLIHQPEVLLGNLLLLIVGGNDTTRNSITGGVLMLNKFPSEYEKLRQDVSLIPNMVSEIIRMQTPLAYMRRVATQDVELRGKKIKKGDKVVMWYMSGNRDTDVIRDADRFIIDREKARHHLSFGFGVHRCMGNRLAEMQLQILWEEIMKRFAKVEVLEEPERVQSNFVNGYKSMMVKLHKL
ncbi:MAG TPA: cytochrome P450 [Glaciecola sp.]|jgi:cytochrome P450|nr:cytochrome P450 [Glaciecola sp.]